MPLYGSAQAGWNAPPNAGLNLSALCPGESYTLFNGTESPGAAVKSVAFARGTNPALDTAGTTFTITFASAPTAQVLIQASNVDLDAQYQTLWTSNNLQTDNFTDDVGRWAFYRAVLNTYAAGGMPTVIAQR